MNKTSYTWAALPDVEVLLSPAFGLAQQGEVRFQGTPWISFVLYPQGNFGVVHTHYSYIAGPAISALARMIYIHHGSTKLEILTRRIEPEVRALPSVELEASVGKVTVSRWLLIVGDDEARLDILDDLVLPMAALRFRSGRTNDQLLWYVALTAIQHRGMLLKRQRPPT